MVNSSSSLYWEAMALYKEALARFDQPKPQAAPTPDERLKRDNKLSLTAQVFTAAVSVGELANAVEDEAAAECLTLAEIALLSHILTQIGPYGDMPQDVREKMVALLNDFETMAPTLARLRDRLIEARLKSA